MFTKKKFQKLEKRQQHKHCAHLLRSLYEQALRKEPLCFSFYQTLQTWMGLPLFSTTCPKELSNQYHYHLLQSNISLKEHNLLPPIRKKDHTAKKDFGKACIYLDQMRSAYNVGNILRTIEALRLGPVYFHPKTPFVTHDKVQKVSMGAYLDVPAFQVEDIHMLPKPLIALETGEDAEDVRSFLFPETFTLVVGNEEYGISDPILQQVDYVVTIPLFGKKNSINAAAALAIAAAAIEKNFRRSEEIF